MKALLYFLLDLLPYHLFYSLLSILLYFALKFRAWSPGAAQLPE